MDAPLDSRLNVGLTARLRLGANMEAFLREYRSREVWYFPVPGDAGDSLLQVGVYQALRRAGIAFRIIDDNTDLSGKIVFIGGGGNLTRYYKEVRDFIVSRGAVTRTKQLVVLPHTINGNADLLAELDDRVILFCRESKSYDYVTSTATTRHVYIDHDMGVHVDVPMFYAECDRYPDVKGLYAYTLRQYGLSEDYFDEGLKFCLRQDGETSREAPPLGNVDLSPLFSFGTWPENSYKAAWCLLRAVSKATQVITDRLHVATACALVNTSCILVDNNYGKCSGVYNHTIRKYSAAVMLADSNTPVSALIKMANAVS